MKIVMQILKKNYRKSRRTTLWKTIIIMHIIPWLNKDDGDDDDDYDDDDDDDDDGDDD